LLSCICFTKKITLPFKTGIALPALPQREGKKLIETVITGLLDGGNEEGRGQFWRHQKVWTPFYFCSMEYQETAELLAHLMLPYGTNYSVIEGGVWKNYEYFYYGLACRFEDKQAISNRETNEQLLKIKSK
jgi:hypothetical protein